jgi:ribonuclease HII
MKKKAQLESKKRKRSQLLPKRKKNSRTMKSRFNWRKLLPAPIVGVDEVGRGCLAGPVYAAAVILNSNKDVRHYTDSKLISENRREKLSLSIQTHHRSSIGVASVEEIERLNILQASLLAMKRAVFGLGIETGHLLVDGKFKIPGLDGFLQTPLVKGDLRASPISAASIIAKVARDQLMKELAKTHIYYGFEKNKGYGTEVHRLALAEYGPTPVHRKTFFGVREFFENSESDSRTQV